MKDNYGLIKKTLLKHKNSVILIMGVSCILSLLGLIVPFAMQYMTDNIIIACNWELFFRFITIVCMLIVVRYLIDMLYERLLSNLSFREISYSARENIEKALIYIDSKVLFKEDNNKFEHDIETIISNDVDGFRNTISQVIKFGTEFLKLTIYLIVLFGYSIPIGCIALVRIPIYYVLVKYFDKPLERDNEIVRKSRSQVVNTTKDIFSSIMAIKTLKKESDAEKRVVPLIKEMSFSQGKVAILNSRYQEINTAINTLVSIVVLIVCGFEIKDGKMSVGTMMLITNVQSRTTMPLFFFNNMYIQYKANFPGLTRMVRFLLREKERKCLPNQNSFSTIEFKHITYSYDGKTNAIDDITFTIKKGDKIILRGDNMAGKSTFLLMFAGMISPDKGEILMDGKPVNNIELRSYTALLLQTQENYTFFNAQGSGGEVQLKNVDMVCETTEPILLLDEPDTYISDKHIDEVYKSLGTDRTVIMVTHRDITAVQEKYPEVKVISI